MKRIAKDKKWMTPKKRQAEKDRKAIKNALGLIARYGSIDGEHHKNWVIDQVVRALTGCPMRVATTMSARGEPYKYREQGKNKAYLKFIRDVCAGEDGPDTYEWDKGTPP